MSADTTNDLHNGTSKVVAVAREEERLTIALALQVERFLLGVDNSISLIANAPHEREEYPNMILMLNNWENLVGYTSLLRKCFNLANKLPDYRDAAISGKITFDNLLPHLVDIRNVFEHFDEYVVGKGRDKSVDPIQAISDGISRTTLFYADLKISIPDIEKAVEVVRKTLLTGYVLSVIENKKNTFSTLIQRKK